MVPLLLACGSGQSAQSHRLRRKFRGLDGTTIVFDAIEDRHYLTISSDDGRTIFAPSLLNLRNRRHLSYSNDVLPVPRHIRFIWRERKVRYDRRADENGNDRPTQSAVRDIVGDYTIPVAERIPDEVLDEIRANGGELRLKFRVHDKGVYLGWDIERRPGYTPGAMRDPKRPGVLYHFPAEHHLAGGDFREARIFNGKPVRKGWYIDADGQRIETDF